MAYSSNLNKIQTDALDAKIQDLTLTGNVVTNLLLTNKPKEFQGKNYTKVIATKNYVTESGTTTPATGLVQFEYAIPQTLGTFTMEPKFHKQEIAVDTREVAINNIDPKAAVKLKLSTTQEAANAFSHKMGTYLYGTTAAETTNATNSLRAIFDDGGEATTYGGVTRSSLADGNLNAYAPAGVGALTSSNDEYVITALSAARVGGQTPNLILTTDTIYNLYEGLLTKTYNVDSMVLKTKKYGFVQGVLYFSFNQWKLEPRDRGDIDGNDRSIPVITRIGKDTIFVTRGTTYTDAGATAYDNLDGVLTTNIVTTNPVNAAVIGTYIVIYNVKDNAGNSAIPVQRIVIVQAGAGINTVKQAGNIVVYPNPVSNVLNLSFDAVNEVAAVVNITDINGKELTSQTANFTKGINKLNYNTSALPKGMYLITIKLPEGIIIERFIK